MCSNIKKNYKLYRNYLRDSKESSKYQVRCFNTFIYDTNTYLAHKHTPNHWLYRFIVNRVGIHNYTKKRLSIFGTNGYREAISLNKDKFKLFYTAENVHDEGSWWAQYEDLLIQEQSVALSLGFDYINSFKYLRFPFWMMVHFDPEDNYEIIKKKCEALSAHKNIDLKDRFCSFICRNDYNGDRRFFYELINSIDKVDCPSTFMHNTDDLLLEYNNDKRAYLKNYKFNLCPENSNFKGLVTEKIFDAIHSGCIPIYWGAENNPEPDILNSEAIIFLNKGDNFSAIKDIEYLYKNKNEYIKFASKARLKVEAPEIIYDSFQQLERKIIEIIS